MKAFTPRVVANLEPRIRDIATQLLAAAVPRGEFDVVAGLAARLPMMVIAEMLGIPSADAARFNIWADAILKLSYTVGGGAHERAMPARATGPPHPKCAPISLI